MHQPMISIIDPEGLLLCAATTRGLMKFQIGVPRRQYGHLAVLLANVPEELPLAINVRHDWVIKFVTLLK